MSVLSGKLINAGTFVVNQEDIIGIVIEVPRKTLMTAPLPIYRQVDVVPSGAVSEALEALKIAHNTITSFDPNEMGREDEVVAALKTIDLAIEKLEGGES